MNVLRAIKALNLSDIHIRNELYEAMQWNVSLSLYENWTGSVYEPNYQSH